MLDLLKVEPQFTRPACRVTATHIDQYLLPARPTPAVNQLVVAAAIAIMAIMGLVALTAWGDGLD